MVAEGLIVVQAGDDLGLDEYARLCHIYEPLLAHVYEVLDSLMVLVQLRIQLYQVLKIDYRVLKVAACASIRLGTLNWWAIWAVEKNSLRWRNLLKLLKREVLPLQVD